MNQTGVIELINTFEEHGFFGSGGPSHIRCTSCKQAFAGYPRTPKTLVYRCNTCGHMFDIYGKPANSDSLEAGGVFFNYEELQKSSKMPAQIEPSDWTQLYQKINGII